ncbi:hypothetical protein BCR39DRAFT_551688 [Naematelia encephala]|uniref:C3H1-type domain-containing protein n=1 Tax=Naematelia encephala TaxID=71784 RepID=A0A1Y2AIG7_9TREE|nr:hypothetical protein BCR39DRAFT_551688 [Naematelia encephala]
MASSTALERQKLLLQQEIAKLSNVVNSRPPSQPSSHKPSYHPYRGRPPRGSSSYRGGRGSGRGNKASYSLDLRAKAGTTPPVASSSTILPSKSDKEEGEVSPEKVSLNPGGKGGEGSWVQARSGNGNLSLMTAQKRGEIQDLAKKTRAEKAKKRKEETPHSAGQRVVIDGVVFQFEQGGAKLTRIGELGSDAAGPSTNTPTRKRLSYAGKQFRRTSKGNLVSSRSRPRSIDKQCRFFAKTGRCNNALTCPYKHDPSRVSACPKFLSGRCPFTAETCPLSHTPTAHNTPSCQNFQATSTCHRRSCPYPHIKVADNAPVCEPFALEGWCEKEPGSCTQLHTWECPEWRSKGTCSRAGRCGLRHVLKAEDGRKQAAITSSATSTSAVPAETQSEVVDQIPGGGGGEGGTFEDQADFIDFGPVEPISESDHASPSEESSEDDNDDDEDDDDDDDDEGEGEEDGEDEGEEGEGEEEDVEMLEDHSNHGKPPSPIMDTSQRDITPSEADEDEVLGVVL